jgi:hypothetical protein
VDVVNSKATMSEESIDGEILKTTYPRLIASGDIGMLDPVLIAAEGYILVDLSQSHLCKPCTHGCGAPGWYLIYLLNVEYTPGVSSVYAFLEAALLNNLKQARKRSSVQELIN